MDKSESLINCNTCKIRKVKCSRELPICSYCSERDITCIYSGKIRRRGVSEVGLASFISKIKVGPRVKFSEKTFKGYEKNEPQVLNFILFQPILQPTNFVDEDLQEAVTKLQLNETQKFQTHILLTLSTQIINYDSKLMPQIDFFISKLELGVFGGLLKFTIHMNQDWISELFSPSFEENCITCYFQNFHLMATYISKYKFYTNSNAICPVLKSVMVLVGYSSNSKQSPELLKYLKHVTIVQLKKNMFNIKLTICQAMLIFSSYLIYRGFRKQSSEYFHQGYLMASALGIHKDIPGFNEMDRDERRWVRFTSYSHDSHLCSVTRIQPHYLFIAPSWTPLNPIYQTDPHSKDPNEFLIAECICLSIKCYNMYWTISGNLMVKYSQATLFNPKVFLKDNITKATYLLQVLLNHSLIRTLDLHLILSRRCRSPEGLEIVKNFAKIHVRLYHTLRMVLNSQFSPSNQTLELDQNTKNLLWSAQGLYQNSIDVNLICIPTLYYNLCTISLLYVKLILTYGHVPQLKGWFIDKLQQVYGLFNSYKSTYNISNDFIDVIDIIASYYNIKV
jgi:hypothetical protein